MSDAPHLTVEAAAKWFTERVPEGWFEKLEAVVDRDEILVTLTLPTPEEISDDAATRIDDFREATRDARVAVAAEAERRFVRKVSWAAISGDTQITFTHLGVPVMTRLRIEERHLLDTLIAAGVARSRSDAAAWCVRQVAEHQSDWLAELRGAIEAVDRIRAAGPG